jgi:hypothetical protein
MPLSCATSWFHLEMDAQAMDMSRARLGVREFTLRNIPRPDGVAEYIETKEQRR